MNTIHFQLNSPLSHWKQENGRAFKNSSYFSMPQDSFYFEKKEFTLPKKTGPIFGFDTLMTREEAMQEASKYKDELCQMKGYDHIQEFAPFQQKGILDLAQGYGALAVVPTGSGKTIIPQYAIQEVLNSQTSDHPSRLIYTLPRKAVINQKYQDFIAAYEEKNVGIMTGDVTENREAPIIVMTTEVWREILSKPDENKKREN